MEKESVKDNENKAEGGDVQKQSQALTQVILKDLVKINGKINKMNTQELIRKLRHYRLDTGGTDEVRRKRLKNNYRKIKLASADLYVSNRLLPYYVIVDFEATCEEVNPADYKHEVIEFPAVMVNSQTQEIVDTFQMYCKPKMNQVLSDFCVELTGISQEQVDSAQSFEEVLKCFEEWLLKWELGTKHKFAIVTDGPWDMTRFLYGQCQFSNIPFPEWGNKWVNLRKVFSNFYRCKRFCLKNMLEYVDMDFEGRPHCGLDDARNIARILLRLVCDGANVQINEKIQSGNEVNSDGKERNKNEEKAKSSLKGQWEGDLNNKMKDLKLEAQAAVVRNNEPFPTFERVQRERSVAEAKIAIQISKESKAEDEPSTDVNEDIETEWLTVQTRPRYVSHKSKRRYKK